MTDSVCVCCNNPHIKFGRELSLLNKCSLHIAKHPVPNFARLYLTFRTCKVVITKDFLSAVFVTMYTVHHENVGDFSSLSEIT